MKRKKSLNFFFLITAAILGPSLYKLYDFESRTFENNGLAIIYSITFLFSIFLLIKDYSKQVEK